MIRCRQGVGRQAGRQAGSAGAALQCWRKFRMSGSMHPVSWAMAPVPVAAAAAAPPAAVAAAALRGRSRVPQQSGPGSLAAELT